MINYNLAQLLSLTGVKAIQTSLALKVNEMLTTSDPIKYDNALREATEIANGYDPNGLFAQSEKSQFGFPVFLPLTLKGGGLEFFFESAIVDINRTKNIVITEAEGLDNSVKEFIGNGDFNISVTGFLSENTASYPLDQLTEFNQLMELKIPLQVESPKLNALNIFEMVVTGYGTPPSEFVNLQPYYFNNIDEKPAELTIQ